MNEREARERRRKSGEQGGESLRVLARLVQTRELARMNSVSIIYYSSVGYVHPLTSQKFEFHARCFNTKGQTFHWKQYIIRSFWYWEWGPPSSETHGQLAGTIECSWWKFTDPGSPRMGVHLSTFYLATTWYLSWQLSQNLLCQTAPCLASPR